MRQIQSSAEKAADLRMANDWGIPAEGGEHQFTEDGERIPDLTNPWETKGMHPDTLKYWQDYHAQNPQGGNAVETPHRTPFGDAEGRLGRVAGKSQDRDGWERDDVINGYRISNLSAKFSCNCGKDFMPEDKMHRCACGQTWTSFVIVPNGKQASQAVRIVRPVKEHRDRVLASLSSPEYVRTAAGGWGDTNEPGFAPVDKFQDAATTQPATDPVVKPAPRGKGVNPYNQKAQNMNQNTRQAAPLDLPKPANQPIPGMPTAQPVNPALQNVGPTTVPPTNPQAQNSTLMPNTPAQRPVVAFVEEDFRLGWALASSDSPLPSKKVSKSFLHGYSEFIKSADFAPGHDTIDHLFEKEDSGNLETMDRSEKTLADVTEDVREDLAGKLDKDTNNGQSQSEDMMTDLSGWKTSALLAEIQRRATRD